MKEQGAKDVRYKKPASLSCDQIPSLLIRISSFSVPTIAIGCLSLLCLMFFILSNIGVDNNSLLLLLYGAVIGVLVISFILITLLLTRSANTQKTEKSFENLPLLSRIAPENFTDNLTATETKDIIDRHKTLTENLAASVVIRNKDSHITYCSPYTEVLTGYPLSNIYGSNEDFFVTSAHEEDRDKFKRALLLSKQGEAFQFRYRFFHKTGIEMWAEMRTVPVIGTEGTVVATLSITLDVTGTVRYQQQVEERNKDLNDFSYMISHDLKAPIFTIKGMLNVLHTDYKDKFADESATILDHISSAADRLSSLVNAVLEYSKVTNRQSSNEPVPLGEVINEVINDYTAQIKESDSKVSFSSMPCSVVGDRLMIYQIFSNLIGNAIKYRDPNKQTLISIEGSETSRSYFTVTITDNGIGIPSDKLDDIFRPFKRVNSSDIEGSGIGLACVKKLIHKLNGKLSVSSTLGSGSSFSITLPIYHHSLYTQP